VFDEARYFEPARGVKCAEFRGMRLAVTICEDFWNDRLYWKRRSYDFDPVEELAKEKPDLMVTISASPYWVGKARIRDEMYAAATRRHGIPLAHVNMVAGNDSLIFDGRSNVWGRDGGKLAEGRAFEEDLVVVEVERDTDAGNTAITERMEELEETYRALTLGVRDYVRKCGFKHVLIGLSGGDRLGADGGDRGGRAGGGGGDGRGDAVGVQQRAQRGRRAGAGGEPGD
jgi:NAD+ synthase (glutamine-hydrolysing)